MYRLAFIATGVAFIAVSQFTPTRAGAPTADQIRSVTNATNTQELREAYCRIFCTRSDQDIEALTNHSNDAIALHAYWAKLLREEIPASDIPEPNDMFEPECGKGPQLIGSQMAGFVSGRLRVLLPKWWKDEASRFNSCCHRYKYHDVEMDPEWTALVPNDLVIKRNGPMVDLKHGSRRGQIEFAEVAKYGPCYQLSACVEGDIALFVCAHDSPRPYWLLCADATTGVVKWKSIVDGLGQEDLVARGLVGQGGVGVHNIYVAVNDERVIVAGSGGGWRVGGYVETFDVATGKSLVRFATLNAAR